MTYQVIEDAIGFSKEQVKGHKMYYNVARCIKGYLLIFSYFGFDVLNNIRFQDALNRYKITYKKITYQFRTARVLN